MTFPLNLQSDIDEARLSLLRRRAYITAISDAFDVEDVQMTVDLQSANDFAERASDAQRERFFDEAPAEIAAAFVLCLSQADRATLIAKMAGFKPDLFAKLFEGL